MEFEEELRFLKEHKNTIISSWIMHLNSNGTIYAGQVDLKERERVADLFVDYMTDFHIDPEVHPFINVAREWSEKNFRNYSSYSSILNVNDKLRDAMMHIFLNYENQGRIIRFLSVLLHRQNIFFREYSETHMKIFATILNEKDSKINKLHDDRLNMIGKMASSMAHEIRNPLTSIAGFLKLIRHEIFISKQTKLEKYIDVIDEEFTAINMHITGFLSFSRNNAFEEEKIEISVLDLINSTLFLLHPRLINENISLSLNIEENCFFNVGKISIQQVISNIISNAIDSLITIEYDRNIRILSFQHEESVYIHIVNNGPEIPKEIRKSLFLPFYTNKENGTGLGLAICRELMTKNNGSIDFISNASETNFILSLKKAT